MGERGGRGFSLAVVQSDHKALSLIRGLWQDKAVCATAAATTPAPTWQPPHFPSSPCLGSWPTSPCRPAKRIRTGGTRGGEGKKRALLFFSCLLASPPVTSPPLRLQMRGVQKCFSPGLFDLAVHFINAAPGAVSRCDCVGGGSAQNGASCSLQWRQNQSGCFCVS